MDLAIIWQNTIAETSELLRAPIMQPDMFWIIIPLIVTFLVMTFYFGLYTKEELGWNTAVGNSLVLMFVFIDLLRKMYNYTTPGSIVNFVENITLFVVIFFVIIEAILLFVSAFTHAWPRKIMFFIASPLPVNIQAYIIIALVYTRAQPEWYTLLAGILMFAMLFVGTTILQYAQRGIVMLLHKSKAHKIRKLKEDVRSLKAEAKGKNEKIRKKLLKEAENLSKKAKEMTKELKEAEMKQHKELREAKGL